MRKKFGLCQSLEVSMGYILSYCLGYFYGWRITCFWMSAITILAIVLTLALPETPYWLIEKGRNEEAL